ncbi:hypothetical protein DCAR_0104787 [Daucus carota subsp. sativus]|uniref:Uncharacterized protein n=1 Tax=Daucus carota subsp. sativus TaxID=79200 RepID=A0A166J409_DAUCS|nr:hypothetical protein DCAR_0104787 [Daucus carota subsp. sativus]
MSKSKKKMKKKMKIKRNAEIKRQDKRKRKRKNTVSPVIFYLLERCTLWIVRMVHRCNRVRQKRSIHFR